MKYQFLLFLIGKSYGMLNLFEQALQEVNENNLKFVHFYNLRHHKAIELMKIADALVCFNPNSEIVEIPAKIHEYIQTAKPIIYISKNTGKDYCAEYLKSIKFGLCCNFEKKEIIKVIKQLIKFAKNEEQRIKEEFMNKFEIIESNWWGDCIVKK